VAHEHLALSLVLDRRKLAESLADLWADTAKSSGAPYEPFDPAVLASYLTMFSSERIVDAMMLTLERTGRFEPAYCVGILRNWLRDKGR